MKKLVNVLVLTLPIVVAFLGLGEVYFRLAAPQDMSGAWFVEGPRGLVLNKAAGSAEHQFGNRTVAYRFNRFHQRGKTPPDGIPRILVVGDSFTFGWLLEERDSPPALLQAAADRDFGPARLQFLNAGTGGWGLDSALAYLEAFGDLIAPKAVIVSVNGDSFRRAMANGLYSLATPGSTELTANSVAPPYGRLKAVLRRIPFYDWLLAHSHLAQFLRKLALGGMKAGGAAEGEAIAAETNPPPDEPTRALGRALLKRIGEWCQSRGLDVFVIADFHPSDVEGVFAWLHEATAVLGIPFLDLQAPMAAAVGPEYGSYFIRGDGHPNARANALAATLVWRWLKPRLEKIAR